MEKAEGTVKYDSDGWHYVSHLSPDNQNETHSYYEIPKGGSNRWHFNSYFEKGLQFDQNYPTSHEEYYYGALPGMVNYHIEPSQSNEGNNSEIWFNNEAPKEDDAGSWGGFEIYAEASMGPLSTGIKAGVPIGDSGGVIFDEKNYYYSDWEIDATALTESCEGGVFFDVNSTGGSTGWEYMQGHSKVPISYYRQHTNDPGSEVYYSETVQVDHYFNAYVV